MSMHTQYKESVECEAQQRQQKTVWQSKSKQVQRKCCERTGKVFPLNDTIRRKLRTVSTGKQRTLLFDHNNNGNKHNLNLKLILTDTLTSAALTTFNFQLAIINSSITNTKHKTQYKTNSNRPTYALLLILMLLLMLNFLFTI